MNCFKSSNISHGTCPYCGKNLVNPQEEPFLPQKTLLADRYYVGKAIKMDGEGLEYAGYDKIENSRVYIREFFPSRICQRDENFKKILAYPNKSPEFQKLLKDFLKYFRSIARLRNLSSIAAVYDIFEENNTAYVIFEWIEGIKLDKYMSSRSEPFTWHEAQAMFMPLLSSLIYMSNAKVHHLGICPENIIVTPEQKLKLSGFATKNLRNLYSDIEGQLYDGCSAIEQYTENFEPSEITDVYGFSATLFWSLTGEYPLEAPKRKSNDKLLMPKDILEILPENVISALANALRVYPNSRTISFENLRIELSDSPILHVQDISSGSRPNSPALSMQKKSQKNSTAIWGIVSCACALIILVSALIVYWFWLRNNSNNKNSSSKQTEISEMDKVYSAAEEMKEESKEKSDTIPVPNLIGKNYKSLNDSAKDYQLAVMGEDFSDKIEEGSIISQNPSPGEEMERHTAIAVNLSKGSKQRILPEVKGKSISEASQLITAQKLVPVQTFEFSKEFAEGVVIGYKNYNPGEKLEYGSEVTIVVSKGSI